MGSGSGVGALIEVKGTLNQNGRIDLLSDHFLLFSTENLAPGWMLQQDNALCHKSKKVLQWFEANEIDLIDWPVQSLDLNPIENLGELSKSKFEKKKPKIWKI